MKLAVLKETDALETRVAITPETAKKYVELGFKVCVQSDAGKASAFTDACFKDAGAEICETDAETIKDADVVLAVRPLEESIAIQLKKGCVLIGVLEPYDHKQGLEALAAQGVTACALELLPRITRAQVMDVLSSQSNLAGYKAVIEAASYLKKAFPMMMTAAGTVAPARVVVLGAGVAGLQAIATAKRMGAIVRASDVRPAVKEQVESLGGKFIDVKSEDDNSGEASVYAKEMSEDYKHKQAEALHKALKTADIAICTALIPGKPAPKLITNAMLRDMPEGSVVVDMAAGRGGNCEGSVDGQIMQVGQVAVMGASNLAAGVCRDASKLYAKNLYHFVSLITKAEPLSIALDLKDEIVAKTVVTHDGQVRF